MHFDQIEKYVDDLMDGIEERTFEAAMATPLIRPRGITRHSEAMENIAFDDYVMSLLHPWQRMSYIPTGYIIEPIESPFFKKVLL